MSTKVYKALRFMEKRSTVPLVGVCLYEAIALGFPKARLLPITVLSKKHKWVFPAFCLVTGIHIYFYEDADA